MHVTIDIPDELAARLRVEADAQQRSVEHVVLDIVGSAVETLFATPEQIVARIQAMPRSPDNPRPAQGSLADALRTSLGDPQFDLDAWHRQWGVVEAEIERTTFR